MSDELRAGLYAFDLVQKRARRPAGAPDRSLARPVTKVGVVGAGLMAGQLALLFARRLQVPVVLTDLDQARLDKGVGYVHGEIDELLGKKRHRPGRGQPAQGAGHRLADQGRVRRRRLRHRGGVRGAGGQAAGASPRWRPMVSAECVLATNTSSLSVTEMAAELAHPERVVGFHFFNPVAVLPLLEVVRGPSAPTTRRWPPRSRSGRQLKKSCVLVKDAPAFVVNRLLTRFLGEVTAAVDEGTPVEVADRALAPLGLPMSPFALLALVGPAVALHVGETLHAAFPRPVRGLRQPRAGWSRRASRACSAGGRPGRRSTRRWRRCSWSATGRRPPSRCASGRWRRWPRRSRLMLDEGVVAEPQDIDLCMLLGAGWPFHLGGITPYLDRTGVSERVTGRRFLPPGVAGLA